MRYDVKCMYETFDKIVFEENKLFHYLYQLVSFDSVAEIMYLICYVAKSWPGGAGVGQGAQELPGVGHVVHKWPQVGRV